MYFGAELLEKVPHNKEDPAFKLLLGRLLNSGIKVCVLEKEFRVEHTTIKRWAQALVSGDPQRLLKVLAGRGANRKLTAEIQAFVRMRFKSIYPSNGYSYSKELRGEIKEVFQVPISRETLRPLLKELKEQMNPQNGDTPAQCDQEQSTAQLNKTPTHIEPKGAWTQPTVPNIAKESPSFLAPQSPQTNHLGEEPMDPQKWDTPGQWDQQQSPLSIEPTGASTQPAASNIAKESPILLVPQSQQTNPLGEEPMDPQKWDTPGQWDQRHCPLNIESKDASTQPAASNIAKESPILPESSTPQRRQVNHLGILLFSGLFLRLENLSKQWGPLFKQWLATLLLGAINIEQTKLLCFSDLQRLLGKTIGSLRHQRDHLTQMAKETQVAEELMFFNAQELQVNQQSDFYFDPHTKHYTGMRNILKGWCPRIRGADKVVHSDFIHSVNGTPLYFETTDNYADMRERFWKVAANFRKKMKFPDDKTLTFVIDRGIYAMEVFERLIEDPTCHIITWEKGYRKGQWDESQLSGQCAIQRPRNNASDLQTYHFKYMDRKWGKNPEMRQLIVKATNPKGHTVEVSIITDDLKRLAPEAIQLIFSRWVQENDFKYLDKHFGINQVTSYAVIAYKKLVDQLEERQIKSGEYKAIEKECRQKRLELGRLMVSKKQSASGKKNSNREKRIELLSQQLHGLEKTKEETQKEVDRAESLIGDNYVKLDGKNKLVMDCLKIIARNAFYQALVPFKEAYDNYRDDHEIFRNLIRANGIVIESAEEVKVYLNPTMDYPCKLREIVADLLEKINQTNSEMPDGSKRIIRFKLLEK